MRRWRSDSTGFKHATRSFFAINEEAVCLATYKIEKSDFTFYRMEITVHRELEPHLLHVMLFGAAYHITRSCQFHRSARHTSAFEHPRSMSHSN